MKIRSGSHKARSWAIGLSAYTVFLAALAPATLLDAGLDFASGGRLRLAEAHGSAWSGTGQLEVRDAAGLHSVGRTFTWRAQPESFLRGRAGFQVEIAQAPVPFTVELSATGVEVLDAGFDLPAAMLGIVTPQLAVLGPTGDLRIRIARLNLSRGMISGTGSVDWLEAGSTLSPVSPLGNYTLRLDAAGGRLEATLSTLTGPLHIDGKGTGGDGPQAFAATARIDERYQLLLAPFLRMIAVERGDGTFDVRLGRNPGQDRPAAHT